MPVEHLLVECLATTEFISSKAIDRHAQYGQPDHADGIGHLRVDQPGQCFSQYPQAADDEDGTIDQCAQQR